MSLKHKRKRKVSAQKLAQSRAECKQHFFGRVERIFSFVDGEEEFRFLSKIELESIYLMRGLPFKIIGAPNESIENEILKEVKFYFHHSCLLEEYPITENGNSLSLFEFFTIGLSILIYLKNLDENKFKYGREVKELLKRFKPLDTIIEEAFEILISCMTVSGLMVSYLTSKLFWLEHKYEERHSRTIGIQNIIYVHSYSPVKINIGRNGDKLRPAIKVCTPIAETGIHISRIKKSLLGINDCAEDSEIDVFIQMHALQRLKERLDCLDLVGINLWLFVSLKKAKVLKTGENNYLIEFSLDSIAVGYLVADIQEGKIIIRTFLFITQSRTPEGTKLKELYGLGKLDVSYIEMDKLSTYIYNDLCSNPGISEIFQKAGCQYLLDLYTDARIKSLCHCSKNYSKIELMIKYLGLKKESNRIMGKLIDNT